MTADGTAPSRDTHPFEHISVWAEGDRGELLLNRPDKLNPLGTDCLHEIELAARWFDEHHDLKVVVVAGAGRAFSAGADVMAFAQSAPMEARQAGWRMARALDEMRAVTVARIQGWCIGGGLVVASGCDLRVAAESARFSIPEIDIGIPLAWGGIPRLVREIGPALTKELVMTCRPFDADEARSAGFVNRVVADDAVQQCYRVSPGPDFVLIVRVKDMPASAALAQRLFSSDANVRNVKAFFSVHRAKFRPIEPLPLRSLP